MTDFYSVPFVNAPFFTLIFTNASASPCTVWIALNGEWWAAPQLEPGASFLPVPVLEGFQVDRKIVSGAEVDHYNTQQPGTYDSQVESILQQDHLIRWQGSFHCHAAQLGRGVRVEIL